MICLLSIIAAQSVYALPVSQESDKEITRQTAYINLLSHSQNFSLKNLRGLYEKVEKEILNLNMSSLMGESAQGNSISECKSKTTSTMMPGGTYEVVMLYPKDNQHFQINYFKLATVVRNTSCETELLSCCSSFNKHCKNVEEMKTFVQLSISNNGEVKLIGVPYTKYVGVDCKCS